MGLFNVSWCPGRGCDSEDGQRYFTAWRPNLTDCKWLQRELPLDNCTDPELQKANLTMPNHRLHGWDPERGTGGGTALLSSVISRICMFSLRKLLLAMKLGEGGEGSRGENRSGKPAACLGRCRCCCGKEGDVWGAATRSCSGTGSGVTAWGLSQFQPGHICCCFWRSLGMCWAWARCKRGELGADQTPGAQKQLLTLLHDVTPLPAAQGHDV